MSACDPIATQIRTHIQDVAPAPFTLTWERIMDGPQAGSMGLRLRLRCRLAAGDWECRAVYSPAQWRTPMVLETVVQQWRAALVLRKETA